MFTSERSAAPVRPWALAYEPDKWDSLCRTLDHAAATVPYFMARAREHGGTLPPDRFPLISKKQFIDHEAEMLSVMVAGHRRVYEPPVATGADALICEFTSGSTGYPMQCYKTIAERTRLALSLHKKRAAAWPAFSLDRMFGFIHNTAFESRSYADSLGNLSDANIGRVLAYLRDELRPAVLHGNTMVFVYYADYIRRHGFALGPWRIEFIESVSESISPEQRRHIEEQFRTTIFNCYGCLECYNVAYDCAQHQLHVNEHVVLEVVDPVTTEDLTASGREGEIVLTSLVNRAQPVVRYKTGDLGSITESACACGSRAPIVSLSGRRKLDYVKLLYTTQDPGLTICGYDIFATVMYRLVTEGHDYVSWYNVVQQELDLFEVLYCRKAGFSDEFVTRFQRYAVEELGRSARFEFVEKDEREVLLINKKNRVFRSRLQND